MKVLKWGLASLVALVALVVGGFLVSAKLGAERQQRDLAQRVAAVCEPGPAGPTQADVARLATDPVTRSAVRECLIAQHKLELMPAEQRTQRALAESRLVSWLLHPHEL